MQELSLEHIVCSRYWGARDIYVKFLKREKKIPCPWSSGEVWDLVPCHMQWKSAKHYDNGSDSDEDRKMMENNLCIFYCYHDKLP